MRTLKVSVIAFAASMLVVASGFGRHNPVVLSASPRAGGQTQEKEFVGSDSGIAIDPALRMGTLPNGLRYYVRANASPANRANLWLAVDAGSLQEDDDQLGFAHFLEHMAFNGTRHFPGNTLVDVVEMAGMNFGADLNASTSFDRTIYKLTMPTDDTTAFRQGMQILDDWATGGILMDSMAVVGERGVVMGEWRQRIADDTVQLKDFKRQMERWMGPNSRYAARFPIGDPKLLESANPAPLTRFYRDWYRPDRMAVIVVGDFDAKAVERDIIRRFGKMPAARNPRPFMKPTALPITGTMVKMIQDPEKSGIELQVPRQRATGTARDIMRDSVVYSLLIPYMQGKYVKMSRRERRPFAGAQIGNEAIEFRGQFRYLKVVVRPDSLLRGFAIALTELQRVAQHGMPVAELKTAKAALVREYEQRADGSEAVSSQRLVEHYTQHYLDNTGELWGDRQALALVREVIEGITSEDLAKAARFWLTEPRLISVYWPTWSDGSRPSDSTFLAILDSMSRVTVLPDDAEPSVQTLPRSLFDALPPSGRIVREEVVTASGKTADSLFVWTLSNGARVVWKPSSNHPDQLLINGYSLGGHSVLADSLFFGSGRLAAAVVWQIGTFGQNRSRDEVGRELSTTGVRRIEPELNAFEEEITVEGSIREAESLFQLLHLQIANPTIDTVALKEWRKSDRGISESPNDQMARSFSGNFPRLTPVVPINILFVDVKQAMRTYRDRFGDASDFTYFIIGAVPTMQIRSLVERYVANLPSTDRTVREHPKNFGIQKPSGKTVREVRDPWLSAERASSQVSFYGLLPSSGDSMITEVEHAEMAAWIVSRRLRNRLREQMAVTYGVNARVSMFYTPDLRYIISIQLITAPEAMTESVKALWEEIETLRNTEPTAREIEMALHVQRRSEENGRQNNVWWIQQLQKSVMFDLPFSTVVRPKSHVPTGAEIRQAVNRYFSRTVYQQMTVLPTDAKLAKRKVPAVQSQESNP